MKGSKITFGEDADMHPKLRVLAAVRDFHLSNKWLLQQMNP